MRHEAKDAWGKEKEKEKIKTSNCTLVAFTFRNKAHRQANLAAWLSNEQWPGRAVVL